LCGHGAGLCRPNRLLKNHYRGVISSLFVRLMKRFGRFSWGFRGPDAA
jgi:hypothetical protein